MEFNYQQCLASYNKKISLIQRMVIGVATSNLRGLIISGTPGIGKSHTITTTLEAVKKADPQINFFISKGHITPYQLYTCMCNNRGPKDILVFDDCDAVLDNTQALNLLKAATEYAKKRYISWNSTVGDAESMINYEGKIIIATNKRMNDNPHYQALLDRIHYYDMKVTFAEKLSKIIDISKTLGNEIDPSSTHLDVIEFLLENADKIDQGNFSIRNFIKLVEMKALFGDEWKDYLGVMHSVVDWKNEQPA